MNPIQNSVTSPTSGSVHKVEPGAKRSTAAGTSAQAGAVGAQAGGDMVSISNSARLLNASTSSVSSTNASDMKIAELKSAIASGHFAIDPQKIAQGLLRDSQALQKATGQ